MLDCVLVTDRGVAGVRVLVGLERLGVKAVAVHVEADAGALHVVTADDSVLLGPLGYDDPVVLVEAARQAGADGVHPGARELPGLREACLAAGLAWCGDPLPVPVTLHEQGGVTAAEVSDARISLPPVAPRCAEVVTGLDLTCAALSGEVTGVARDGVAVSVEVRAASLAPVTAVQVPDLPDVWVDLGVAVGETPHDLLLAVVTAWGADRTAALALARTALDQLTLDGPEIGDLT